MDFITSALDALPKLNLYILLPVLAAVGGFAVSYVRNYQRPAERLRAELTVIVNGIRAVRNEAGLSVRQLEDKVDYIFEQSRFSQLWAEYRQSLHTVHVDDDGTELKTVLATAPAEAFFTKETLIDLPINADFYRHLPGILTGIGIIGTFSGLVWGLHQFRPDPDEALSSLPLLLQEVTSAFIGSGVAILAAIFITYKEKAILNQCYRLVEALNREIDSLHALGTGEEYLARLVKASESSPVTLREIKTSLMDDMARLMYAITERQAETQRQHNEMLSQQISEAIRGALAEPMGKISGVVQNVTTGQYEAVGGLLETLLEGFMSKLGDSLGQQIQGINQTLQTSSSVIGRVQDAMTKSIGDISAAGMTAAERMSDKLEDSLSRALQSQQQINLQLMQHQQQSSTLMDTTMERISGKLEDSLSRMARTQEQLNMQALQQQQQSAAMMDEAVGRVSGKLEDTLTHVNTVQEKMNTQSVDAQRQSAEIIDNAVGRISIKLEDSIAKVITAQEQINLQTLQQQQRASEMTDIAMDRLSGRLEDSLSRLVAVQEQTNVQTLKQQQQTTELMDMALSRISAKLEQSLARVTEAQDQMNDQTMQLQKQSAETTDIAVRAVLAKLQGALASIAQDRAQQVELDRQRHESLIESTMSLYSGLSTNVGRFIDDIKLATFKAEENLSTIQRTTLQSMADMREGANVMRASADRFTAASNSISGMTDVLMRTATGMQQTVESMQSAYDEYDRARIAVQDYVGQLQSNLDLVRRENGVSQALVGDMERIVDSLAGVERQSKEYLDRVNEVLKRSFQDFGVEMVSQVRAVGAESNRQLGSSLNALSSTVDSMIASVTKLRRVG